MRNFGKQLLLTASFLAIYSFDIAAADEEKPASKATTEILGLGDLNGTQPWVSDEIMTRKMQEFLNGKIPQANELKVMSRIGPDGAKQYFVMDGHHQAGGAFLAGQQNLPALVYDEDLAKRLFPRAFAKLDEWQGRWPKRIPSLPKDGSVLRAPNGFRGKPGGIASLCPTVSKNPFGDVFDGHPPSRGSGIGLGGMVLELGSAFIVADDLNRMAYEMANTDQDPNNPGLPYHVIRDGSLREYVPGAGNLIDMKNSISSTFDALRAGIEAGKLDTVNANILWLYAPEDPALIARERRQELENKFPNGLPPLTPLAPAVDGGTLTPEATWKYYAEENGLDLKNPVDSNYILENFDFGNR